MKYAKLFSFILLIAILGSVMLTACSDSSDQSGNSNPANTSGNASDSGDDYKNQDGDYVATTSGNRYDGETITFLTCSVNDTYESEIISNTSAYKEESLSQSLPQIINDDMKKRADILEEQLGLTVEEIKYYAPTRPGDMCTKVLTDVLATNQDYQVIVPCLYDGATLAMEDVLHNLKGVDGLQIDAPWWNQTFNDSMTYAGQLYFTIGDIGLVNKNATAALYFNLELWEKYHLSEKFGGNPYELVRSGKWTLDVVVEAASQISSDVKADGKIDYNDEFGWGGQLDDMWSIFFGSGEKIASADADGYPTITIYNERSARLMEKLQEFVQDDEHYISANDYFGVVQWPSVLVQEAFTSGRALFYNASVGTVIELGNMEQHFGLAPIPKFEESQDEYYSLVNPWTATCFAIPISVTGETLTMTADALNVLGATSMNTVAKDYQETVLKYMKIRDDESIEMLEEYTLPTRACDVGMVYKWGGLDTLLQEMASANVGTFSSKYLEKETQALADLEDDLDFFKSKE